MDANKLKSRIDILSLSYTRDAKGGMVKTYTSIDTIWAEYIVKSGREYYTAQRVVPELTAVFRIRYRSDVKAPWRIRFRNKQFDILYVDDTAVGELLVYAKELAEND